MGGYVNRTKIAQLYADAESLGGQTVTVAGWVKSVRDMKNFGFVTLNDGSCFRDLQVVMNREALDNYDEIAHQNVSAALICTGTVKLTPDAPSLSSFLPLPSRSRARAPRITRCRRSVTVLNICVPLHICVPEPIRSRQCSEFVP